MRGNVLPSGERASLPLPRPTTTATTTTTDTAAATRSHDWEGRPGLLGALAALDGAWLRWARRCWAGWSRERKLFREQPQRLQRRRPHRRRHHRRQPQWHHRLQRRRWPWRSWWWWWAASPPPPTHTHTHQPAQARTMQARGNNGAAVGVFAGLPLNGVKGPHMSHRTALPPSPQPGLGSYGTAPTKRRATPRWGSGTPAIGLSPSDGET